MLSHSNGREKISKIAGMNARVVLSLSRLLV